MKDLPTSYKFKPLFGSNPKKIEERKGLKDTQMTTTNVQTIDGITLDETGASTSMALNKEDKSGTIATKKKNWRDYLATRSTKVEWCTEYWWLENVPGNDGKLNCKVCSFVEKGLHLLDKKLDTIQKHEGKKYKKETVGDEVISHVVWSKKNTHKANELKYLAAMQETEPQKRVDAYLDDMSQTLFMSKRIQFVTLLHLLSRGKPMLDYEAQKSVYQLLEVQRCPRKHWSDNAGWEIVECMDSILKKNIVEKIQRANYFSVSLDEVTANDLTQWLGMHIYVVVNCERVPLYLCMQKFDNSSNANVITEMVIRALHTHGGLSREDIAKKCVCVGCDGASVLQGCRSGVCMQLELSYAPFMVGIHCMAHRTNLAGRILSDVQLVSKIEALVHSTYTYFARSPKRWNEFKMEAEGKTNGLRLLRDVETRWISLYKPCLRLFKEYISLVAKMDKDVAGNADALSLYESLTSLHVILGLPCILPMLEEMNALIKVSQLRDIYVHDYAEAIQNTLATLESMYNLQTGFTGNRFKLFNDLVYGSQDESWLQFDDEEELCVVAGADKFKVRGGIHGMSHRQQRQMMVDNARLVSCIEETKQQCNRAAMVLCAEIRERFPPNELLQSFSIIYPQFWKGEKCDELFEKHLIKITKVYCARKDIDNVSVNGILDGTMLAQQSVLFKMTMKKQAERLMAISIESTNKQSMVIHGISKVKGLWQRIGESPALSQQLSEFLKLAELVLVMIIGSIEDERTFSRLDYVKNKKRNRLDVHLDCCLRMYEQSQYDLQTFPYEEAFNEWKEKSKKGRYSLYPNEGEEDFHECQIGTTQ